MLDRLIRWLALTAALLLACCMLDGAYFDSKPSESRRATPAVVHELILKAQLGERPFSADRKWTATVFVEQRQRTKWGGWERLFFPRGKLDESGPSATPMHLSPGAYWVIARAEGLSRVARRVDLSGDAELELVFRPSGQLDVKVLAQRETDMVPLIGATVLVGDPDGLPLGAATDDEGRAVFDGVPQGPVRVRIFAPGYEPYDAMAERSLLVRLRPASTLRVTVTDRGVVQPQAKVFIAGAQLWPARVVVTGDKGFVEITGLQPGRYFLYAEKGNRVSPMERNVEVLSRAGTVEVELGLGGGQYAGVLVMAREGEKPIDKARVTWSATGVGQFSRHEFTEKDGTVRIGPLVRLDGVLSIRAAGFVSRVVPVEPPSERDDGSELQIVRLERSGTVEGRVVDSEGFPVAGASVEIAGTDVHGMPISVTHLRDEVSDAHFDWADEMENVLIPAGELGVMLGPVPPIPLADVTPSQGRRLTTNEKGYFEARDVPPGEMVVLARHPAYMDGKSRAFELSPGGREKVRVVLGQGKPLRGRVLDHQGFPVAHARVRVSARGFDRRVSAESDGTFALQAAPEQDLTLRISRLERPLRVLLARKIKNGERHEEIEVTLPQPREPAELSVVDDDDEPVALAQVAVTSLDRQVPFKSTRFTGDEGNVTFEEARGLRVRVEVAAPGYVTSVREQRLKAEGKIALTKAIAAHGRVTAVRGRMPAAGARVTFESGPVRRTVVADDVGEYRLLGLPPGLGELSASHPELGSGRRRVRLQADPTGRDVELPDLDLSPMLEISGKVVDDSGRPVSGALLSADRISPFLPLGGNDEILGESDESGEFRLEVPRAEPLYLYGADPGRAFGFSDVIRAGDLDRLEDVVVILDRQDKPPPQERGTVLVALERSRGDIVVYAVAPASQASRAGFQPDDVIVEIEDTSPRDVEDARQLLSGLPGSELRVVVERSGRRFDLVAPREAFRR